MTFVFSLKQIQIASSLQTVIMIGYCKMLSIAKICCTNTTSYRLMFYYLIFFKYLKLISVYLVVYSLTSSYVNTRPTVTA